MKICKCCEVEKIKISETYCNICIEYCEHLGINTTKQKVKFKKISVDFWECIITSMKIRKKEKNFFILYDNLNFVVSDFFTFNQCKQGARDYMNSLCETKKIFNL